MNKRSFIRLARLASLWLIPFAFSQGAQAAASKILIVFFSQPEQVALEGVDAISGASVLLKNHQMLGNTEYIAHLIQQQTQGQLFRIETSRPYPLDHDPLVEYADQELKQQARPALKTPLTDLERYDTVFIGYPIWWYKMPMPLYSFLEQYDLAGKRIIPFSTHGGSRFSGSIAEIARLQPHAKVVTDGLTLARNDVAREQTQAQVSRWLQQVYAAEM